MPSLTKANVNTTLLVMLSAATLLRLAIFLSTLELFSTDIWPLIRGANVLLSNPAAKIWLDEYFDGYNNRWPGIILSTAITSMVTGLSIRATYTPFYVIVLCFTIMLVYYVMLKRLLGMGAALVGLACLSFTPPLLVFTSAPLKEVYAYPFHYMLLYAYVSNINMLPKLALLIALPLSMSHPLVTFYTIGFLTSAVLVEFINRIKGVRESELHLRQLVLTIAFITLVFTVYMLTYGIKGFKLRISYDDVVTYTLYVLLIYGLFALKYNARGADFIIKAILLVIVIVTLLHPPLLPVNAGKTVIVYVAPILASLALLALFDFKDFRKDVYTFTVAWLLLIAVNCCFIILARPEFANIFHRIADYIVIAASTYIAYIASLRRFAAKTAAMVVTLLTIVAGILTISGLIIGFDDVSYYWVYSKPETFAYSTIESLADANITLVGDAKIYYYFLMVRIVNWKLLVYPGLEKLKYNNLLVVRSDNLVNGFVLMGVAIYKPKGLLTILQDLSRLFDNGDVWAYMV